MNTSLALPEEKSQWRHHNGNIYEVIMLANEHTQRPEKYPVSVIYKGENNKTWCRKYSLWHESMTFIPEESGRS